MVTSIIFSIYFCIGISMLFFGPLAKRNKRERHLTDLYQSVSQQPSAKWRVIGCHTFISISVILLWPVFIIDHFWLKRQKNIENISNASNLPPYNAASDEAFRKDPRLYFFKMPGVGVLECNSCGLMQEVISSFHAVDEDGNSFGRSARQCMSCGKYTTLSSDEPRDKVCECGGELSHEKPVFCTRCKSYELKYTMDYIN